MPLLPFVFLFSWLPCDLFFSINEPSCLIQPGNFFLLYPSNSSYSLTLTQCKFKDEIYPPECLQKVFENVCSQYKIGISQCIISDEFETWLLVLKRNFTVISTVIYSSDRYFYCECKAISLETEVSVVYQKDIVSIKSKFTQNYVDSDNIEQTIKHSIFNSTELSNEIVCLNQECKLNNLEECRNYTVYLQTTSLQCVPTLKTIQLVHIFIEKDVPFLDSTQIQCTTDLKFLSVSFYGAIVDKNLYFKYSIFIKQAQVLNGINNHLNFSVNIGSQDIKQDDVFIEIFECNPCKCLSIFNKRCSRYSSFKSEVSKTYSNHMDMYMIILCCIVILIFAALTGYTIYLFQHRRKRSGRRLSVVHPRLVFDQENCSFN